MRNLLYLIASAPWWWYASMGTVSLFLGIAGIACDRPGVAATSFLLAALYALLTWQDYKRIAPRTKDTVD